MTAVHQAPARRARGALRRRATVPGLVAAVALGVLPAGPGLASDRVPEGRLVTEVPAAQTPDVLAREGGRRASVLSVVQAGSTIVLGGEFDRATAPGPDEGQDVVETGNTLAFDADTGALREDWPSVDGTVEVVLPDETGETVFLGGQFRTVGDQARRNLARVRVSDGAVLPWRGGARAEVNGPVEDLRLVDGRLWLAGGFVFVDGRRQPGLATLDATTGAFDPFMRRAVTGLQRPGQGTTDVRRIDVTPDGRRLVGVGNFRRVGGKVRRQLVVLGIGGRRATVASWRSSFFGEQCKRVYDSYVKDVDLSPDGSWFAVATTGANGGAGSACDSVTRFETRARGGDVRPTWIANTGGDTTWAVEADDAVLYTGGHFQWQNNPYGQNKTTPGAGAVVRTGLAALDPRNGLPLDWNPTRTRGKGVFDFLRTDAGLYVASDTDTLAGRYRGRIGLLAAGGAVLPAQERVALPADVLVLDGADDPDGGTVARRLAGQGAVVGQDGDLGPADWSGVRTAFLDGDRLYAARDDGRLTVQDLPPGQGAPGPATEVDTADQVVRMAGWHAEVARTTGMFLDEGRLYYTLRGSRKLFVRGFSPQSGVVGAQRQVASGKVAGFDPRRVRDPFLAGQRIFWSTPGGDLRSAAWRSTPAGGAPVARTAGPVPGSRDRSWSAAALVVREP